jgi:polysaccharide deacetylase family protein (PEP-CTERM system associated)
MNILTFDIEEWFHILDNESTKSEDQWSNYEYRLEANVDRILSLLDEKDQSATFFVLGWVARKFPQVVRRIWESEFEIATHSDKHQLAYTQTRLQFAEDLKCSISSISDITGEKVTSYRAPGFSLTAENSWVFDVLIENGIEIDCSVFPAKRAHGGFESFGIAEPALVCRNGTKVKEFPINVRSYLGRNLIFSGGGYFRLLPYVATKRLMNRAPYVMTYFHPRDFDPEQPMIEDLSLVRKFKSYYGLKSAFSKLERLISDFEFIDLREADRRVDWQTVKSLTL